MVSLSLSEVLTLEIAPIPLHVVRPVCLFVCFRSRYQLFATILSALRFSIAPLNETYLLNVQISAITSLINSPYFESPSFSRSVGL